MSIATMTDALSPAAWLESSRPLPGRLLFSKVWGSHSHNTALPTSDVDYLVVYIAENNRLLGLDAPPDTITGEKPDYQCHEVGKFCGLLLKGNPGIVEMLFTDRLVLETPEWLAMKAERRRFLTGDAVGAYLGYCQSQLKKLWGRGYLHTSGGVYNAKWAYHLIRLAQDAKRIAQGNEPIVWKDGDEHQLLMDIRAGALPQGKVEAIATSILHDIDCLKPWAIPDHGDREFLNDWLLATRGAC